MNIKRFIDRNWKQIWRVIGIIICILFAIKFLNTLYEKDEEKRKVEANKNQTNKVAQIVTEKDYTTQSDSIKITMTSFVNYCNNRELDKAYKMLTDECKNAMFPTIQDFEKIYINKIYNIARTFEMERWLTNGNKSTFLVTLYGDILATGSTDNSLQEYYTFIEDENGNYQININNYIYGKDKNLNSTIKGITVEIGHVDIYEEYEEARITITNNTSKTICLTGNRYKNNIHLENAKGVTYSPLNSEFDYEEIILEPNSARVFYVEFNKMYDKTNQARYLVLSDVILDYGKYLECEDKLNYSNRTSIKVDY